MKGGTWLKLVLAAVALTAALYVYGILPKPILQRPAWASIQSVRHQGLELAAALDTQALIARLAEAKCRLTLAEINPADMPAPLFIITGKEGQRGFQLYLWAGQGFKLREGGKPYLVQDPQGLVAALEALLP